MPAAQIAIIDRTGTVDVHLLRGLAAAINTQVTRDLPKFWGITAKVGYLPATRRVPAHTWPVYLVDVLPPGEAPGFHFKNRRPFAKVMIMPLNDRWTIGVSHEIIEMLVDPSGNLTYPSRSIELEGGRIVDGSGISKYIVEACDPCEHRNYSIHGITVSDFVTPEFYAPAPAPRTRYSFTGTMPAPRRVLRRGYISWQNVETDRWHQCHYHKGASGPNITNLPRLTGGTLRECADAAASKIRGEAADS